MDLNDVLSDKPVATPEPETAIETDVKAEAEPAAEAAPSAAKPEVKAEAEIKPDVQRDDKGRFSQKAEEKPEPMVPLSALLAERARRKDPEAGKPKTSVFDDEDKGISERVAEHVEPLQRQVFDLQLKLAKTQHTDFDDVVMTFLKASQTDALLKYQADNAPDPLAFIYREGKRLKELSDVDGDIGKYREKVTAEERAKYADLETRFKALEAENKALKQSKDKQSKVPQSLNSEQSAAADTATFAGPTPIKAILNS
jgi:hypothetical protein